MQQSVKTYRTMDDWVYYAIVFVTIVVVINILNSRSAAFSEQERKKGLSLSYRLTSLMS